MEDIARLNPNALNDKLNEVIDRVNLLAAMVEGLIETKADNEWVDSVQDMLEQKLGEIRSTCRRLGKSQNA